MAKTPLDEKWRYCARCGFRTAESNLFKDPETGNEYCTTRVVCVDEKSADEQQATQKGEVFGR